MNKLLFVLFVTTFWVSTVQAIACYHHYDRCAPTEHCLNETTKRNCTNPAEQFCFKETYLVFFGSVRGCAEAGMCNASTVLTTRYCCNTDYCNHAMTNVNIHWGFIGLVLAVLIKTFK